MLNNVELSDSEDVLLLFIFFRWTCQVRKLQEINARTFPSFLFLFNNFWSKNHASHSIQDNNKNLRTCPDVVRDDVKFILLVAGQSYKVKIWKNLILFDGPVASGGIKAMWTCSQ